MNDFYSISMSTSTKILQLINERSFSEVSGGLLEEFEGKVSDFFGHKHGVATCNGTSSIHLAFFALNIKKGDVIINTGSMPIEDRGRTNMMKISIVK